MEKPKCNEAIPNTGARGPPQSSAQTNQPRMLAETTYPFAATNGFAWGPAAQVITTEVSNEANADSARAQ